MESGITAKMESSITGKGIQSLATSNYCHPTYPNINITLTKLTLPNLN